MPQPYEWAVLRVVPRVERCEFVNVGVVVYCRALDYLDAVTTDDLDPCARPRPGARRRLRSSRTSTRSRPSARAPPRAGASGLRSPGDRFRWLVAPRSTVVQPSPVHTGITDDPAAELADLVRRMVDPPAEDPAGR